MKRVAKSIIVIITAVIITSTFVACGNRNESYLNIFDDINTEPTYLSIFSTDNLFGNDLTKYWSDYFTESYDEKVYINFDGAPYYVDTNLSYRELLLQRIKSSSPDDMYIIKAEDVLEFDKKGYWLDLSDMDFVNNLSDAALQQSTYNGKVFSIPLSFTGFGLLWNVDLLARFGLSVPHKLSEFERVCKVLKENGILPYGANKGYALTVPAMCVGLSKLYGSEDLNAKVNNLNSGAPVSDYMKSGYEFLQWMIDCEYLDPQQALNATPGIGDFDKFLNEECAFICASVGEMRKREASFNWVQTGLPVLADGCISVYGANDRLCVNPNTKNLSTVKDFIDKIGTPEALTKSALIRQCMSSAKNDYFEGYPSEKQLTSLLRQNNQIPNQDFALHFNTWESIRDGGRLLCSGSSVKEVCEWLDEKQKQDLLNYGNYPARTV